LEHERPAPPPPALNLASLKRQAPCGMSRNDHSASLDRFAHSVSGKGQWRNRGGLLFPPFPGCTAMRPCEKAARDCRRKNGPRPGVRRYLYAPVRVFFLHQTACISKMSACDAVEDLVFESGKVCNLMAVVRQDRFVGTHTIMRALFGLGVEQRSWLYGCIYDGIDIELCPLYIHR
jgi:hypothetical protein